MYDINIISEICSNYTVLLVDDEEDSRTQVYNILILFFSVVLVAKNGEEAFEIYKQNRLDVIITDLTMPNIDGFELMNLVRSITPKQKIIIISAHVETDIIVKAIRNGVDGYILKPIETSQMFEALEKTVTSLKIEQENISYQEALERRVDKQKKQLIEQLEYDSLTGLPNKKKLHLDFKTNNFSEIILLNIDNFSHINSAYGYENGDLLLKQITQFLQQIVKNELYKGDGDEFLIALELSTPEESLHLVEEIKQKVYTKRFDISSTSSSDDVKIPYAEAQLAILDMRKLHKNGIGHYHKHSYVEKYQQKMHEWAHKAKLALDFDLLVPYYQPIINISTGKVEKNECLARILEQEKSISPYYFIEPARTVGMLTNITRQIILKSFESFSNSSKEFSINITDNDFKEEYLIRYLQDMCAKYDIEPSQVVLEVLENISNYDAGHAIQQIDELKSIGFQIAIDDFGAESSNFARVQKLQIDYIKIDGGFIKDISKNNNSMIIVKTIIYYAKSMNIKTIAEYVHDKETYQIVKNLGINYAQGFYLSEPLKEIS